MSSQVAIVNESSDLIQKRSRLILASFLVLAFGLRLIFIIQLPNIPLYWDEFYYNGHAKLYENAWHSLFQHNPSAELFELAFEKSLQKGELYSALVGFLYTLFGQSTGVVFIFQAILDTLSCLFIYFIAARLGGIHVGFIALGMASFYEPFMFSSSRIQTESFASFLFLGGLCTLFTVKQKWQIAGYFTGGLLIALSMLTKPLFKYIFFLLIPIVLFLLWNYPFRRRIILALMFAIGFFSLVGPRLVLTNAVAGHPLWNGTLKPNIEMYAGAVIENAGWKTDRLSFSDPPRGELLKVLGNDHTRTPTFSDYRQAALRTWLYHPIDSGGVMLHKIYEAWANPYNDSRYVFLSGTDGQKYYHQLILVLGVIGIPLALSAGGAGISLVLVSLYLWLVFLSVKIEVRNAFPVMPLMICFSAIAARKIIVGTRRLWHSPNRYRILIIILSLFAVIVLREILSLGRLLQLFPTLSAAIAHTIRVFMGQVIILTFAYVLIEIFCIDGQSKTSLAAKLLLPLALTILVFTAGRPKAYPWHQWKTPLYPGQAIARQEFFLPADLPLPEKAELKLDLLPTSRQGYDFVAKVNGKVIKQFSNGLERSDAALPAGRSYSLLFHVRNEKTKPPHAWYTVPVPLEMIQPGEQMRVDLEVIGNVEDSGFVTLFGDFSIEEQQYDGPSLLSPVYFQDTSIYKYLVQGDFRMRRKTHLNGLSKSSSYDGMGWSDSDLSIEPGRQFGRYRIFLVLTYKNRRIVL